MKTILGLAAVQIIAITLSSYAAFFTDAYVALGSVGFAERRPLLTVTQRRKMQFRSSPTDSLFSRTRNAAEAAAADDDPKLSLLNALSKVPPNESTPEELTREILRAVGILERDRPTPEADVIPKVAGNWELLWTAQDVTSLPASNNPFATFINPLENQSYSNNPSGRSNPILPRNVQDGLEDIGLLRGRREDGEETKTTKSTQAINLKKNRIRNVVAFEANNPTPLFSKGGRTRGFITVDVRGAANPNDARKIDVKFDRCRLKILDSPVDVSFPLGVVGPTGWLRTVYVDDDIRVTRGHKGSVFILSRTASAR